MNFERIEETEIILESIEKVIRRLIRLVIGRVSFDKLFTLIRQIYVEETELQLRKESPGKQIPLTRLALITGLNTRVLAKIKNSPEFGQPISFNSKRFDNLTPEANLLDLWRADPRFFDDKKRKPKTLAIWGGEDSFERLVYDSISTRGITIQSVLQRMSANESIAIDDKNQTVRLTADYWEPFKHGDAIGVIETGFIAVCSLIDTVTHNFKAVKDGTSTFYQRAYWVNRLNPQDIEEFRKSMNSLLEKSANETVTAMEKFEQPFPAKDQRVGGFSLSYFEPADIDGQKTF